MFATNYSFEENQEISLTLPICVGNIYSTEARLSF